MNFAKKDMNALEEFWFAKEELELVGGYVTAWNRNICVDLQDIVMISLPGRNNNSQYEKTPMAESHGSLFASLRSNDERCLGVNSTLLFGAISVIVPQHGYRIQAQYKITILCTESLYSISFFPLCEQKKTSNLTVRGLIFVTGGG